MNTALVYVLCVVWCCCSGYKLSITECGSDGTLTVTETHAQSINLTCTGIRENVMYWDLQPPPNRNVTILATCTWPPSPCMVTNSDWYEVSRTQNDTSTLTVTHTTKDTIAGRLRCGEFDSRKKSSCNVLVVPATTTTTTTPKPTPTASTTTSTTATKTPSITAQPPTSTTPRDTRTTDQNTERNDDDDDDDDGYDDDGLPIPVIAGGAGGGLLVIIIVVVVVVIVVRKRRNAKKQYKGSPRALRNANPIDDDDDFEEHINCLYESSDATHYSAASRRLANQNADAVNPTNGVPGTAFGLAAAPVSASLEMAGKAVPNDYEEADLYSAPNDN